MEDIASFDDDQIGAAVRSLHDQARDSLARYLSLQPVIDGVEGAYTRPATADPAAVKFIGNVPATKPEGGTCVTKAGAPPKWIFPPSTPSRTPPSSRPPKSRSNSPPPQHGTEPRYVIGIDLGTTNSALSYVENRPDADPFALPKVELLASRSS
jgi:hypothetical protein